MAEITAEMVKQLRDETNVSMMECKRALVDAGGDMEKAKRLLRERGMVVAGKKAGRTAKQGLIASARAENGSVVSLVEVNCETDFVARNADFIEFVRRMAEAACTTDAPLADQYSDAVTSLIAKIGENIVLRRNIRYRLQGCGRVASYIHTGGKVGVLVEVACEKAETARKPSFEELVRDLTLQVAAAAPRYLSPSDVPAAEVAAEREIYAKQVTNKPPQVVEKIVDGKMKKFYEEVCLLDQLFVKDQKTTIRTLLDGKSREFGDRLTVRRFVRFQLCLLYTS
ncbi:MAG: translation elongation factor Ts, partial [Kiritimatiellae bacterium]|nr:translation elongation factor Ts [Kiritimatiellia bacterium]